MPPPSHLSVPMYLNDARSSHVSSTSVVLLSVSNLEHPVLVKISSISSKIPFSLRNPSSINKERHGCNNYKGYSSSKVGCLALSVLCGGHFIIFEFAVQRCSRDSRPKKCRELVFWSRKYFQVLAIGSSVSESSFLARFQLKCAQKTQKNPP